MISIPKPFCGEFLPSKEKLPATGPQIRVISTKILSYMYRLTFLVFVHCNFSICILSWSTWSDHEACKRKSKIKSSQKKNKRSSYKWWAWFVLTIYWVFKVRLRCFWMRWKDNNISHILYTTHHDQIFIYNDKKIIIIDWKLTTNLW